MAASPVSGLFTGIDTSEIISKLMAVEKKPLYALQSKKAVYQKQISSYGDLLSRLSGLKESLSFFRTTAGIPFSASSSNTSMLTVSATDNAEAGSFAVEIGQLAKAHRIVSSSGAAGESEIVATGADKFFKFKVGDGGEVYEIALSDGMTLKELRNAINDKNAGITASIINTGVGENPYKLILSSNSAGASKNIIITQDDTIFNNSYATAQPAQNAVFKINGVEIQRDTNTISDVVTGITLNLQKVDADYGTPNSSPITVTVARDTSTIKNKINIFVAQYNNFVSQAKGLSARGQTLSSDAGIDLIINTLRGVTINKYGDHMLVSLGLSHDRDGVLQVNDSRLASALEADPQGVFSAFKAMAESFDATLSNIINNSIPSRKNTLTDSIKRIEKAQEGIETRLSKREEVLKKKFAQLEQLVGLLQSKGNYLEQQLSKLSKTK